MICLQAEINRLFLPLEKTGTTCRIRIVYVGGIGAHYNMELLFKVISRMPDIHLVCCCIKAQWDLVKEHYMCYLKNNIEIRHIYGKELESEMEKADLASIFIKPVSYWTFAMLYKLFEYMSFRLPVISVAETATGDFVRHNEMGWAVEYKEQSIIDLLQSIVRNNKLVDMHQKIITLSGKHTWQARMEQVARLLTSSIKN